MTNDFEALLKPADAGRLEGMARKARALTLRHFGRTIALYAPLYLSNHCPGGCAYCGFASDRAQPRRKLAPAALEAELQALHARGFDEVLLLTGDRTARAGYALSAMAACRSPSAWYAWSNSRMERSYTGRVSGWGG